MPASEPGPGEARGRIVFLNGTSSAGKSSIAGELVRLLDAPWFVMSADAFHAMRSAPAMGPDRLEGVLRRTWRGFHRAVAGMAARVVLLCRTGRAIAPHPHVSTPTVTTTSGATAVTGARRSALGGRGVPRQALSGADRLRG
ncbi:hypothetical protein ACH5AU_26025 [Streptomyces albidoflavus]